MGPYFIHIILLLPWKSASILSRSGNCVFIVPCFQKDKLPDIYFPRMPEVDLARDTANLSSKITPWLFIVADVILISAREIGFQYNFFGFLHTSAIQRLAGSKPAQLNSRWAQGLRGH